MPVFSGVRAMRIENNQMSSSFQGQRIPLHKMNPFLSPFVKGGPKGDLLFRWLSGIPKPDARIPPPTAASGTSFAVREFGAASTPAE
jgi:hypothetical protein